MLLLALTACFGFDNVPQKSDQSETDSATPITSGSLQLSDSDIDFGDVQVGGTTSEPLTLTNLGDAQLSVSISQSGSTRFSLDTTAVELGPGKDEVVTVLFTPDMETTFTGTLDFVSDAGDSASVALTGNGGTGGSSGGGGGGGGSSGGDEGDISLAATSLDFGTLDLGDVGTKTFKVENVGSADLVVSSTTVSDSAFEVVGDFETSQTISAGSSKTVQVNFTPSVEKTYSTTLTLHSDDPDEPTATVTLTGTGEDQCDICAPVITVNTGGADPYTLDTFTALEGFGSDNHKLTITNEGDQDLDVSDITVENDIFSPCGTFALSGWAGSATVKPGASTTFTIGYSVTGPCWDVANPGIDQNCAHIRSNDPAEPDYVIGLGGTGL